MSVVVLAVGAFTLICVGVAFLWKIQRLFDDWHEKCKKLTTVLHTMHEDSVDLIKDTSHIMKEYSHNHKMLAGREDDAAPTEPHNACLNAFPPPASSTGKRYYFFHKGVPADNTPFIACGESVAHAYIGSWKQPRGDGYPTGPAPRGFATMEDALNFVRGAIQNPSHGVITVRWSIPCPSLNQRSLTMTGGDDGTDEQQLLVALGVPIHQPQFQINQRQSVMHHGATMPD